MSIKSKVLAVAVTLTLFSGVGAASALTAGPARAATSLCGGYPCIDVFSLQFDSHVKPSFLVDVYRRGAQQGQPIILFMTSHSDPALDFIVSDIDPFTGQPPTVAVLNALDPGLFSKAVVAQYGNDVVYENEYAPFGVNSDLCVGVASTPFNGEGVTLQPCGFSAKTLWIADKLPNQDFTHGYVPLINGATPTLTHPFVLTYPPQGYPASLPRPQLTVHTLETFSNGSVFHNQLWGANFGVVP